MITMRLQSIIDPKKKAQVLEALRRGDASLLKKKKRPPANPLVEQPAAQWLTPEYTLNLELLEEALRGDITKVLDLLQRGADVNTKDSAGWTPLMIACDNGHSDLAALLIHHDADIHAKDNKGKTAIMYACECGHKRVAELLIKHKAKTHEKDKSERNSLIHACEHGHTQIVKLLIRNKADINTRSGGGWTPITFAERKGQTHIVNLLKKHGAT